MLSTSSTWRNIKRISKAAFLSGKKDGFEIRRRLLVPLFSVAGTGLGLYFGVGVSSLSCSNYLQNFMTGFFCFAFTTISGGLIGFIGSMIPFAISLPIVTGVSLIA